MSGVREQESRGRGWIYALLIVVVAIFAVAAVVSSFVGHSGLPLYEGELISVRYWDGKHPEGQAVNLAGFARLAQNGALQGEPVTSKNVNIYGGYLKIKSQGSDQPVGIAFSLATGSKRECLMGDNVIWLISRVELENLVEKPSP